MITAGKKCPACWDIPLKDRRGVCHTCGANHDFMRAFINSIPKRPMADMSSQNDEAVAAAVLAERWHYPMLAHDLRAIKKSDPQGSDTNLETTASRVAPAASAPCVAAAPGEHWNIRAAFVNRVTKEVSVKFGSLAEAEQFQKHCLDLMGNHERPGE